MLLKDDAKRAAETAQDGLSDDQRLKVQLVASLMFDAFEGGAWQLARQHWEEAELDNDERAAVWEYFSPRQYSKERAYLNNRGDRKWLREYEGDS